MTTPNPVFGPFGSMCERLTLLNGLLMNLGELLKQSKAALQRRASKPDAPKWYPRSGYVLTFADITAPARDGILRPHPLGKFVATGEQFFEMVDSLATHNAGWVVSQGYEAFETFLFDSAAGFLHANPAEADPDKVQRFERKGRNEDSVQVELAYWSRFVRRLYRSTNNQDSLGLLRDLAPGLPEAERNNGRSLDLTMWYAAASTVRHAVTHSQFLIPDAEPITSLRGYDAWFPLSHEGDVTRFVPTVKTAERVLETFAEYAFLVFKHLSLANNYDWNIMADNCAALLGERDA